MKTQKKVIISVIKKFNTTIQKLQFDEETLKRYKFLRCSVKNIENLQDINRQLYIFAKWSKWHS